MPQVKSAIRSLAADSVRDRLEMLQGQLTQASQSLDVERVHDLRVASRRLRTAVRMFGACWRAARKWDKKIGRLTHVLGAARDLDVQTESLARFLGGRTGRSRAGLVGLLHRLQQDGRAARKRARRDIEQFIRSGLCERIAARIDKPDSKPSPRAQAARAVRQHLRDVEKHESCLAHPKAVGRLHKMRIACKHLRYTLEVPALLYENKLTPYIDAARKAQTLLGQVHDCDVWDGMLCRFLPSRGKSPAPEGIAALIQERAHERHKAFGRFVQFWQELQQTKFWNGLMATITSPPTTTTPRRRLGAPKGRAA